MVNTHYGFKLQDGRIRMPEKKGKEKDKEKDRKKEKDDEGDDITLPTE